MEIYGDFAKVYDEFMQDVPYIQWGRHIEKIWDKYNISPKLIAELGCGTGELTNYFAKKDIDVIGIDNSDQMLSIANNKSVAQSLEVLYLLQDMQEFELYGTVDSIYSTCDSLNYLLNKEELLETFKLVNNYLEAGGLFIFDVNTSYKYEEILADNVFAYNADEASYIWENYYYLEDEINEYLVTFFVREESGKYIKYEEMHYERMYKIDTIKSLLSKANMELLGVFDDYSFEPIKSNTQRATFIAREKEKERE